MKGKFQIWSTDGGRKLKIIYRWWRAVCWRSGSLLRKQKSVCLRLQILRAYRCTEINILHTSNIQKLHLLQQETQCMDTITKKVVYLAKHHSRWKSWIVILMFKTAACSCSWMCYCSGRMLLYQRVDSYVSWCSCSLMCIIISALTTGLVT